MLVIKTLILVTVVLKYRCYFGDYFGLLCSKPQRHLGSNGLGAESKFHSWPSNFHCPAAASSLDFLLKTLCFSLLSNFGECFLFASLLSLLSLISTSTPLGFTHLLETLFVIVVIRAEVRFELGSQLVLFVAELAVEDAVDLFDFVLDFGLALSNNL
jgi:uncharacterized membrane protein (DUF485 family)